MSNALKLQTTCPRCKSERIETVIKKDRFRYGEGPHAAELSADVPVRRCAKCKFAWQDAVAFAARHDAICVHLGLLRPSEIRELRKGTYGSREALSAATGIGVASLARWESGSLMQS